MRGAKAGPDYIDPGFHRAACGRDSINLDPWAMRPGFLAGAIGGLGADLVLCEGVMGLFDGAGAAGDIGSTADLAQLTGWPVVMVVDARGQSASAAALLHGFATHRPGVTLAGVIFNRVAGARHAAMLRAATAKALPEIKVLGAVPRDDTLALPSRHLGLVLAEEHAALDGFLDRAADAMAAAIDLEALADLARSSPLSTAAPAAGIPPLGQHIAVARDQAFAFAYPHLLESWRRAGSALSLFSPLADQAPDPAADAVFLPGGYPELHAGRLAAAGRGSSAGCAWLPSSGAGSMAKMRRLHGAGRSADRRRRCAPMPWLGYLLPVTTSFATPKRRPGLSAVAGRSAGLGPAAPSAAMNSISPRRSRRRQPIRSSNAATPTATRSASPAPCAAMSPGRICI